MMERHVELRFDLLMAGIAEIGLRLEQQKLSGRGVMGGMAVEAAQVVVAMSRPGKVHMIFARAVALQTALVDFFCRCSFEIENRRCIARVIHMSAAWPVATFTSLFGWTSALVERGFPMRRLVKVGEHIVVTGLAHF